MKKDRIIQYRGWSIEYIGRDHWDSLGFAGYSVYEIEPDEETLSFGDLESALNYIDDEMDDREYANEQKNKTMETLYRKGDILTAIDPCRMEDSKDQALIPGKEYVIFKNTRNTIWINSEIGEHQFEIKELSEFFDEVIKSDNTETLANALHQIEKMEAEKAELLEALEKCKRYLPYISGEREEIGSLIQKHKQ